MILEILLYFWKRIYKTGDLPLFSSAGLWARFGIFFDLRTAEKAWLLREL
jgi:hypothetical protein